MLDSIQLFKKHIFYVNLRDIEECSYNINQIKQICMNRRNIEKENPQILIISLGNGVIGDFCIILYTFMHFQMFSTPHANVVILEKDI